MTTYLVATVYCTDCRLDLAKIRYTGDHFDDAYMTANMVCDGHRQQHGEHHLGVVTVDLEG